MALPKPVWTDHDIDVAREVVRNPSSLIWKTWNKDPTKITVLRAMVSCRIRLGRAGWFGYNMVRALAQKAVGSFQSFSLEVEEVPYSALLSLKTVLRMSSCPCPNILISGGHLLALLQRKTMKRLSADQILS